MQDVNERLLAQGSTHVEPSPLLAELRTFAGLALPVVATEIMTYMPQSVAVALVSYLMGPDEMTGVVLGNMVGNLLGKALLYGGLGAMETLGPQAVGAGDYPELYRVALRAYGLGLLTFLPLLVICSDIDFFLVLVGQPAVSAAHAREFLAVFPLALPLLLLYEVLRRLMWAQEVLMPFLVIAIVGCLAFPGFCVLLIGSFGIRGVAFAFVLLYGMMATSALGYIWYCHRQIFFDIKPCLSDVLQRAKVMQHARLLFSGIMMLSEWWYFEILVLFAGRLGRSALAAHTVAYSIVPLCFMSSLGIGIATSIRVGYAIGSESVSLALHVARIAAVAEISTVIPMALLMLLVERYIAALFSLDPEALGIFTALWPIVVAFLVINGNMAYGDGLVKGLGLQRRASCCVCIFVWLIGVPLSWFMSQQGNAQRGLCGLWIAQLIIYTLLVGSYLVLCWSTDWRALVQNQSKS